MLNNLFFLNSNVEIYEKINEDPIIEKDLEVKVVETIKE